MADFFQGFSNVHELFQNEFSQISTATHNVTGKKVILKIYVKSFMNNKQLESLMNEVKFLKLMKHPYIMSYYGLFETVNHIVIVLEYINGTTLLDYFNEGRINEFEAQKIFRQIAYALFYLHETCNIVHRDLKLENIMYSSIDHRIKIIDFGVSSDSSEMSTQCGSFQYCAPEIIKNNVYTNSVDIWSAGVMLFLLLTGEFPFDNENTAALVNQILTQDPIWPTHITDDALDLLKRMLEKDPNSRIKINEIMEHKWVKEEDCKRRVILNLMSDPEIVSFNEKVNVDHGILMKIHKFDSRININELSKDLLQGMESWDTITYNIFKNEKYNQLLQDAKARNDGKVIESGSFSNNIPIKHFRINQISISQNVFSKIDTSCIIKKATVRRESKDNYSQLPNLLTLTPKSKQVFYRKKSFTPFIQSPTKPHSLSKTTKP